MKTIFCTRYDDSHCRVYDLSSSLLILFLLQTTSPTGQGRSDSPVYTNLQELKISQSSLPPVPSSSPLHVLGDWETHKDLSGRHFYYNRATGERTWKPPRTRDTISSTSSSRGDTQGTTETEVRDDYVQNTQYTVTYKALSRLWVAEASWLWQSYKHLTQSVVLAESRETGKYWCDWCGDVV